MSIWSAVPAASPGFVPKSRLGLALKVRDLETAVPFYRYFLDMEPVFQDAGCARFEGRDPALRITLTRSGHSAPAKGHYGLQMRNTRFIAAAWERLERHGFKLVDENDVACCYAVQTKLWAADPDGNRWELFVTTEAEAEEGCGPDCICHVEFERTFAR